MNANELLAYNQGYNAGLKAGIDLNTEPMLRQQQAEIEALKSHPAELTDEEIKDFIATFPIIFTPDDLVTFARAILRKAQE